MSELVDFLKARLDEDAAEIVKHPDDEPPDWDLTATEETAYPCFPYIAIGKSRALAEVEAKRAIIAECPISGATGNDLAEALGGLVLAHLAQPYAEHPEFREEWRV